MNTTQTNLPPVGVPIVYGFFTRRPRGFREKVKK